ncbi:hypothetical protein [Carboxylicivirga marina]|uniref:Uncharacterized protein n=1 Tax=Carboxylicivirga marina TaxID=2800988 RepID=A0ABS1HGA4_9BACT|nr:hypothetical protein [Carboxylicivirga marina]MBK3516692.1 hypothetical protein [Carboxylicivirga marina]
MCKIKSVISINQQGTKSFTVGYGGVTEIKDASLEYENGIHIQFDAYDKDGRLMGSFINGALSVEYFNRNRKKLYPWTEHS